LDLRGRNQYEAGENLRNEKFPNLYSSPNTVKKIKKWRTRWAKLVADGEMKTVFKKLVGKSAWKRSRVRPKRRLEDNIKIKLKEMGFEGVEWIHIAQCRE
jgi:hypothetical protein